MEAIKDLEVTHSQVLSNVHGSTDIIDENVIDFDGENDLADPVNWSPIYKWFIVALISIMSLVVNLAILLVAPATPRILAEFDSKNYLESTLLISIWELGEVLGPLIVAPISEILGRLPVYHTANILFIIFCCAAAKSASTSVLIVFRFLNGLTVASTTLNSCIVGDMFKQQERGRAMSIMGIAPFIAPVMGPIVGGFISEAAGWRWTIWLTAIITAAFELIFLAAYPESYKVTILERKAYQRRIATGNLLLKSRYSLGVSKFTLLLQSVVRPMKMLFISPVVLLVSISGGIACSYTYVVITSISGIFRNIYGFAEGPVGLSFLGLGIGMVSSVVTCSITLDWYLKKKSNLGIMKPEYRLPPMLVSSIMIPIGLIIYGWTIQMHVHWIVPIFATSLIGVGFVSTSLAASSYLVDAFGIYAASALAGTTVVRNICAALLPLAAPPLYEKFGYGWGNSILGLVALAFAPIPLLLTRYGEVLRGKSKIQICL